MASTALHKKYSSIRLQDLLHDKNIIINSKMKANRAVITPNITYIAKITYASFEKISKQEMEIGLNWNA